MIKVDWTTFKNNATTRSLSIQYVEFNDYYHTVIFDGQLEIMCLVPKDDGADCVDFETNFKSLGNKSSSDSDGALIVRPKAAKSGWSFCMTAPEFETSVLNSLYHVDSDGNVLNECTLKFYDVNNTEITTTEGMTACTKTVLDFEPPYNLEVIGGTLKFANTVNSDFRVFVIAVPDIPYNYGGSRVMVQNVNLRYIDPKGGIISDGRASKFLAYNATYHTNKLRVVIRHPAGEALKISVLFEIYRA